MFRTGWTVFLVLIVFTLSIGTVIHNHGLMGSDGGAEKISQAKFTCPACVFNGKPVTVTATTIVVCDSSAVTLAAPFEFSFENSLAEATSARAPPAV